MAKCTGPVTGVAGTTKLTSGILFRHRSRLTRSPIALEPRLRIGGRNGDGHLVANLSSDANRERDRGSYWGIRQHLNIHPVQTGISRRKAGERHRGG